MAFGTVLFSRNIFFHGGNIRQYPFNDKKIRNQNVKYISCDFCICGSRHGNIREIHTRKYI